MKMAKSESPHGHFKRRLHQALLLRGSFDFNSVADYQLFIEEAIASLNQQHQDKFETEKDYLQPLPIHRFADYEVISVRVTCYSTITVRCVLYTVSRFEKSYCPTNIIGAFGSKSKRNLTPMRLLA